MITTCRLEPPAPDELGLVLAAVRADHLHEANIAHSEWLQGEELVRYERFKVEHARVSFLSGRIAAKSALCQLHPGTTPADWEIVRGRWSQPRLRGPCRGSAVTIAHCRGAAVAMAFDDRWMLGIDLEHLERDAAEIVASQVTPAEQAWAQAGGQERAVRWMLLWTAREALGKLLGTGLLLPHSVPSTIRWSRDDVIWAAELYETDAVAVRSVVEGGYVASIAAPAINGSSEWLAPGLRWLADALAPSRA